MEFTLKIKLGNDAMQTGDDVSAALRESAQRIEESWGGELAESAPLAGRIYDLNGNRVGAWEVAK